MKLIVGLGNPGKTYQATRHNMGATVVRSLCARHGVPLKRGFLNGSLTARLTLGTRAVIAAVPLSYMNLSGAAVAALAKKHTIDPGRLLVVLDDLDLELGRLKIRPSGSSGGHKGLASIIQALGTQEFARLRVGIGRPRDARADTAAYVLSDFTRKERAAQEEAVQKALDAVELWVTEPIEKTMNSVNRQGEQHA